MTVPVELEVHDIEPEYEDEKWVHIAEASLHLPTDHLQVHECTGGSVADFELEPGCYRLRTFHGGFDTIAKYGSGGADYYKIVMWPAPPTEVVVIKQWQA